VNRTFPHSTQHPLRTSRRRGAGFGWALLALAACTESVEGPELLEQIEASSAPLILDVRSAWEFERGHLPGAVHVPFYGVLSQAESLPSAEKSMQSVVVYCELGPRAWLARAQLWFTGAQRVRYLKGHMRAWRRDRLPLEGASGAERPALSEPG